MLSLALCLFLCGLVTGRSLKITIVAVELLIIALTTIAVGVGYGTSTIVIVEGLGLSFLVLQVGFVLGAVSHGWTGSVEAPSLCKKQL